jgi:hypothetical protein
LVTNLVTIVPRAFTLPCRFETPVPRRYIIYC